MHMLFL